MKQFNDNKIDFSRLTDDITKNLDILTSQNKVFIMRSNENDIVLAIGKYKYINITPPTMYTPNYEILSSMHQFNMITNLIHMNNESIASYFKDILGLSTNLNVEPDVIVNNTNTGTNTNTDTNTDTGTHIVPIGKDILVSNLSVNITLTTFGAMFFHNDGPVTTCSHCGCISRFYADCMCENCENGMNHFMMCMDCYSDKNDIICNINSDHKNIIINNVLSPNRSISKIIYVRNEHKIPRIDKLVLFRLFDLKRE
jgi:hypothetical protein